MRFIGCGRGCRTNRHTPTHTHTRFVIMYAGGGSGSDGGGTDRLEWSARPRRDWTCSSIDNDVHIITHRRLHLEWHSRGPGRPGVAPERDEHEHMLNNKEKKNIKKNKCHLTGFFFRIVIDCRCTVYLLPPRAVR